MAKRLLQIKVIVIVLSVVLAVSAISSAVKMQYQRRMIDEQFKKESTFASSIILSSLIENMIDETPDRVKNSLQKIGKVKDVVGVYIYDTDGEQWQGFPEKTKHELNISDESIQGILDNDETYYKFLPDEGKEGIFQTIQPVHAEERCFQCHNRGSEHIGLIEVRISYAKARDYLQSHSNSEIFWNFTNIMLLVIILVIVISIIILKPITNLTNVSKELANGKLNKRAKYISNDEIGDLSKSFNLMASTIEEQMKELRTAREQLQSTFERVGEAMGSALNLNDISDVIIEETLRVSNFSICTLMLKDKRGNLRVQAYRGIHKQKIKDYENNPINSSVNFLFSVMRAKSFLEVKDLHNRSDLQRLAIEKGANTLFSVPLIVENETIGLINLVSRNHVQLDEEQIRVLYALASHSAAAIDHAKLHARTKRLAITDGLTEVYNHRYFYQKLEDEMSRSMRYKRPLSLLMIDIDHFKDFNDTYGHLAGDSLLKQIAQLFKKITRNIDIVARYGGEEFAILLLETDFDDARIFADRVRRAVEKSDFYDKDGTLLGKVTVSIGISNYPVQSSTSRQIIQSADVALYMAKESGRNRVEVGFFQSRNS